MDFGLSFCLSVHPCGIKESQNEQADPFSTFSSPRSFPPPLPLSPSLRSFACSATCIVNRNQDQSEAVCVRLRCDAECLRPEFIMKLTYISLSLAQLILWIYQSSMSNRLLPLMQPFSFHLLNKIFFYIFQHFSLFSCILNTVLLISMRINIKLMDKSFNIVLLYSEMGHLQQSRCKFILRFEILILRF